MLRKRNFKHDKGSDIIYTKEKCQHVRKIQRNCEDSEL